MNIIYVYRERDYVLTRDCWFELDPSKGSGSTYSGNIYTISSRIQCSGTLTCKGNSRVSNKYKYIYKYIYIYIYIYMNKMRQVNKSPFRYSWRPWWFIATSRSHLSSGNWSTAAALERNGPATMGGRQLLLSDTWTNIIMMMVMMINTNRS